MQCSALDRPPFVGHLVGAGTRVETWRVGGRTPPSLLSRASGYKNLTSFLSDGGAVKELAMAASAAVATTSSRREHLEKLVV